MQNNAMNLYQKVEPNLLKLKRRLAKEGINDLSEMDYQKYLRSAFWNGIKEWVLERDNNKCVICDRKNSKLCELEVHHRSYELEVLEGRNHEALVSLCPRCHELVEFYPDKRKRTCLNEKEEKYLELRKIHAEIKNKGLPIKIIQNCRNGSESFELSYAGDNSFLIFYSLESLMFGFVLNVHRLHRDETKIPLPFGRDKFYQKSGAKISNKGNSKELLNVKITNDTPIVKVTKNCTYPLHEYLLSYISEQEHWYAVQ